MHEWPGARKRGWLFPAIQITNEGKNEYVCFFRVDPNRWSKNLGGDKSIEVEGYGKLAVPCKYYGDLHVAVSVHIRNLGISFLDEVKGLGSFTSNCGDDWRVYVGVKFKSSAPIEIFSGFSIWLPNLIDLMVRNDKNVLRARLGFVFGAMKISIGMDKYTSGETTFKVGVHITRTTVSNFFKDMDQLMPGEDMGGNNPMLGSSKDAELGQAIQQLMHERHGYTPAQLGSAVGGFKSEVNNNIIPEMHLVIEHGSKTGLVISFSVMDLSVLGMRFDLALILQKGGKGWGAWLYVGFLDLKNGRIEFPGPLRIVSEIIMIPCMLLGQRFKSLGIGLGGGVDLPMGWDDSHLPIPLPVIDGGLGIQIIAIQDMDNPTPGLTVLFVELVKLMAGDDPEGAKSGLKKVFWDSSRPDKIKNFEMDLQLSTDMKFSFEHTLRADYGDKGVATDPDAETKFRWMSIKIGMAIEVGGNPSIGFDLEIKCEVDLPSNGGYSTALFSARIAIAVTMTYLNLELQVMMKLKSEVQLWPNPFGKLPHAGVIFPLGFGIGIKINYQAPPIIYYFEIEGGIFGCSAPLLYDGKPIRQAALGADKAAALGVEDHYEPAPGAPLSDDIQPFPGVDASRMTGGNVSSLGTLSPGLEDNQKIIEERGLMSGRLADHAGMERFSCPTSDPYGTEVTSVKLAVYANLDKGSFGLLVMIRQFSLGRMIFMFLSSPPSGGLLMMRPLFDMMTAKRLDISVNTGPFPIEMYSGTQIKPGLLIDIEQMVFFGLFEIYKLYIHIQMKPTFLLECHIFISPIKFAPIIEITGLEGDPKYIAVQKQAKADKERAENEIVERLKAEEELKIKMEAQRAAAAAAAAAEAAGPGEEEAAAEAARQAALAPEPTYDTPCKEEHCYTCARKTESRGRDVSLRLACAGAGEVISNVTSAVWGDGETQPAWSYTSDPGLCTNPTIPTGRMMMTSKVALRQHIADVCFGKQECSVPLDRHALGIPSGWNTNGVLALSAAVMCEPVSEAALAEAERMARMASSACVYGCRTCVVEAEADDEEIIIGCFDNSLIVDIDDASYAADDEQPKWWVDEGIGFCNSSSGVIPRGEACHTDDSRVIQQLRRRCVGRRRCVFTWAEVKSSLLPVDECPGQLKRLSVMAQCRKGHVPDGVLETAFPEEFNFLHYEERRLAQKGSRYTSVAIKNIFHMRAAFETSSEILHQYEPKNVSSLAWGDVEHDSRMPTYPIVRRIVATFTTMANEKATDASLSLWKFKVQGSELFWRHAGMLALLDVNLANDACEKIGGCDLLNCHKDKVMVKAKSTIRNRRSGVVMEEELACTFTLPLKGQQSYALFLYGISDRLKEGSSISVHYKPPPSCYLAKGCSNPLNSNACKYLNQDEMPWQPVQRGQWPEFRCTEPDHVEAWGFKVDTKPYCLSPGLFEDSEDCWPSTKPSALSSSSRGCTGTFHVSKASRANVWKASGSGDSDADIDLNGVDGECTMIRSSAGKLDGRIVHLNFEEGPCDGEVEEAAGNDDYSPSSMDLPTSPESAAESQDVDEASPEHKYRCTSRTYGGEDAALDHATLYEFPVDSMYGISNRPLVKTGHIKPNAAGQHFVRPGRAGYGLDLERFSGTAQIVGFGLPEGRDAQVTAALWLKKPDAYIAPDGDALFSWNPAGSLHNESGVSLATGFEGMSVLLHDDGVLNFTATSSDAVCSAFSEPALHIKDGDWHHIAFSVNDETQTAYFFVDGAQSEVKMTCLWKTTPPPPPNPPPPPPSPPPPPRPPPPPSPPSPPPSPPNPPPLRWKTNAAAGELGSPSEIFAKMKDITSRHLLRAESDDAGESLATRIPDAPSATKKKPAPPTFSAASLGGSRHFTYRSTNQSAALRGQMLVGAVYDGHDDRMTHVMDAIIDEVSVYDRVLSAEEVTSMQGRTPCAKRYASDGYAYFPGLTAAHGPEWLAMDNIPACKSGPHTVRVNYLVSEGNNRRLSLTSRDQNSRTVNFPQPFGFDTADMHTWQGLL